MEDKIKYILFFVAIVIIILILILLTLYNDTEPLKVDAGGGGHYVCNIGDCINFNGEATGGIPPYNWSWDFNENDIIDSYGQNPTYCYNDTEPNQYLINLTVIDNEGNKNTSFAFVSIGLDLELGDILYMNIKSEFVEFFNLSFNVHMAMYIDDNKFVESADYRVLKDIDENLLQNLSELKLFKNGVQISSKLWMKLIYENFTIGKVTSGNSNEKQAAVGYALSRLGDPYQWGHEEWHVNPNITDIENPFYDKYYYPDDLFKDYWVCSELVWASYLHQGIQLDNESDCDEINLEPPPDCYYWVGVENLYHSDIRMFNLSNWPKW